MSIKKLVKKIGGKAVGIAVAAMLFAGGCAANGAALYEKNCLACHRFKGVGSDICPDLTEVTKRRSDDWIKQQIRDSSRNNPDAKMPGFKDLSEKELDAILAYLKG